ncbi:MAG: PTS sugar transporter subunit IIA, partial [Sciscionella sp.]
PVDGRVVPMAEVPDPVFAQSMVGPGLAVAPSAAGDVLSPVEGTVLSLHPHAFVVATASGLAVLVHLGIDTVKLEGNGFTTHTAKGQRVRAGDKMISWDPIAVAAAGYSAICPVVALDAEDDALSELHAPGPIATGEVLFHCAD